MESSPPASVPPGSSPPLVALPTQAAPLLRLAAHLPPRAQGSAPDRVSFIMRAAGSSRMGKFALALLKELWSDPKRLQRIKDAIFGQKRPPQPPRPLALELPSGERADLMELLHIVFTILGASMVLALVCSWLQQDEDAPRNGRLPNFVRHGVGNVVGLPPLSVRRPLRPLRIPISLVRARDAQRIGRVHDDAQGRVNLAAPAEDGISDVKEIVPGLLRMKDKAHNDGLENTEQGISSPSGFNENTKDKAHKDSLMKTEQGVATGTRALVQTTDLTEKVCMTVDPELESSAGKNEKATTFDLKKAVADKIANDPVSMKRAAQLQECLIALCNSKRDDKATPEPATRKIADTRNIKQGDKSIRMINKLDDESGRED